MLNEALAVERVAIWADGEARERYPEGNVLWTNRRWFAFRTVGCPEEAAADEVLVCDAGMPGTDLPDAGSRIYVLSAAAWLSGGKTGNFPPGRMVVHTPYGQAADTRRMADRIRNGLIGQPTLVRIRVSIGRPPSESHEPDWYFSLSNQEALYLALDLAGVLASSSVAAGPRQITTNGTTLLWHTFLEGDCQVIIECVEVNLSTSRGFSAEIIGSEGRALLRSDFAPGAIGWQSKSCPEVCFEATPFPEKSSSQHPDTVRGGWELFGAIERAKDEPTGSSGNAYDESLLKLVSDIG